MLLDENRNVIWQKFLPKHLPTKYSNLQIAKFSRWYLQEYPVFIQEHPGGLLVIGCKPNSIAKYNIATDVNYIHNVLAGIICMIVLNLLLMLVLFWHNTHKIEKAIVPILHGIDSIAKGQPVFLLEKGELSNINAQLNNAGRQILAKEKARAEWISGVSHDVRTPLSIILGYADEIAGNETIPDSVRVQADIIRKQSEKLRRLIADLNLTSRLEYSMHPLIKSIFSPIEMVRQVITDFMNSGVDEKYTFEFQSAPDMEAVSIEGDSVLLSRMMSNLIQNSITHNPGGCNISIQVQKENQFCFITITDNGTGIPEKQLEEINAGNFSNNMFGREDEPKHGLGLRLVHQIIDAHNGKVFYKNISPHGLEVSLFIPYLTQ